MSTSIDTRVVEMKFDSAQFERGVSSTIHALDALNKSLKLDGASKGLSQVSATAKSVNLGPISDGVQQISDKFRTMSIVGITALTNIVNKAVNAGTQLTRSLTIDPVKAGLSEYETNLNSIQTILANTAHEGTNLKQVNAALAELNHYSDQTIYNFGEMARNIGTFTAAGVSLETSTAAIKGIANLAAVSGSNSQQAATAMYQLSQALAAGKVSLMDWNSVVNAGMGGKVFQDALKETARAHGVAVDEIIKKEGSFRDSLQKGWITSEILTETLNKFTGDLSESQLKSMGYTEEQIAGIVKMGKTAQDAATKVKTVSQLIGTLQEAAGSGWAQTWQLLFGDFEEARTLFTNVNNVLGGFISSSADARNKVIGDWKKLGGRTELIKSISNAFDALISVVRPIKDAFREIFPAVTGKQLYNFTVAIRQFTEKLKIGGDTANKLKRTFAGAFAVFDIIANVVKFAIRTLLQLFGVVTDGSGSILDITAKIGDFLVGMRNAIVQGNGLSEFFKNLGTVLATPIKWLKQFIGYLLSFGDGLNNVNPGALGTSFGKLIDKIAPMSKIGEMLTKVWGKAAGVFDRVVEALTPFASAVSSAVSSFGKNIVDAVKNLNFDLLLSSINTGLFAGLVLIIKKFLDGFGGDGLAGGLVDGLKEMFGGVTDTLSAMQSTLKAATLLQIAAALGIMTLSVVAMSKIDAAGLTRALTGITAMFVQLSAAMFVFQKIADGGGMLKMPLLTGSLILLAVAIDILAVAVKKLADLSWEELAKGLSGVVGILAALTASANLMPNGKKMISSSVGLVILAGAVKLLADSVSDLSRLNWNEMAKGLVGVGSLLAALTLFTRFSEANKGAIAQGAGIVLLAAGIKILASAMHDFSTLSWNEIGKGLAAMAGGLTLMSAALMAIPPTSVFSAAAVLGVAASLGMLSDALKDMGSMSWATIGRSLTVLAGALTGIALALSLMPPSTILSAAAIMIVATSLGLIGSALSNMGGMSWSEIAKGLVTLAGSLTIIAAAMYAMTGALPGAAALLVVAASLRILLPVLQAFSVMSWAEMGKGLLMLAGVFVVLGAAGVVLTPLVPTLLALGASVALLGVGMLAAGAGVLAFSVGLTALSAAGAGAAVALVAIVSALIGTIPMLMKGLGEGIIEFAKVIENGGPAIVGALVAVLDALITAIARLTPKIVNTLFRLLVALSNAMLKYAPTMAENGTKLIIALLNGLAKNMGKLMTAATNVIVKFIEGISKNLPRVIQAGVDMIIKFVNGIANAIRNNSAAMGKAGANLATAIIEGMVRGLSAGVGVIAEKARSVAKAALDAAKGILGVHSPSREFEKIGKYVNEGFIKGLTGSKSEVEEAFNGLKGLLNEAIASSNEAVDKAQAKLKKLTSARHKDNRAIREATAALKQAKKERAAVTGAFGVLTKNLVDERDKLRGLASQYSVLTEKLDKANEALANAQKTRDDYRKSVTDQYSDLPDINSDTKLTDYISDLYKQVQDTQTFSDTIQKLRDLGLNDAMYKELIAKGTTALPFVQQLLAGGQESVNQINILGTRLSEAAGTLGNEASSALYQAAVDAAAGLVKGLEDQRDAIAKQMEKIADAMVTAIKKKLGIKSPSREFAKIGDFSMAGLIRGFMDSSKLVEGAAGTVGDRALASLRKSISDMPEVLSADLSLTPRIKPVLDLTEVRKDAKHIGSLLKTKPISVETSYTNAETAATGYNNNRAAVLGSITKQEMPTSTPANITFQQYNTSPKALSNAEIYRQTRNQISVARGVLAKK